MRHEDACRDATGVFATLYRELGLTMDDAISARILADSRGTGGGSHSRDSAAIATDWKRRLDEDEIRCLRDTVGEAAGAFYTEADW